MPMAEVIRRFGPLREMGPGRRDRDKPWRKPVSPVEALWYRGWLARAFADTPKGPQEFAFIPKDLRERLPLRQMIDTKPLGSPTKAPRRIRSAGTALVDDATTLLAALRLRPAQDLPLPTERTEAIAAYFQQPEAMELVLGMLLEDDHPSSRLGEEDRVHQTRDSCPDDYHVRGHDILSSWTTTASAGVGSDTRSFPRTRRNWRE